MLSTLNMEKISMLLFPLIKITVTSFPFLVTTAVVNCFQLVQNAATRILTKTNRRTQSINFRAPFNELTPKLTPCFTF